MGVGFGLRFEVLGVTMRTARCTLRGIMTRTVGGRRRGMLTVGGVKMLLQWTLGHQVPGLFAEMASSGIGGRGTDGCDDAMVSQEAEPALECGRV